MSNLYRVLAKMQYLDLDQGTTDYDPYPNHGKLISITLTTQSGMIPEAFQRLLYVAASEMEPRRRRPRVHSVWSQMALIESTYEYFQQCL